jgi:four helix bundle protein
MITTLEEFSIYKQAMVLADQVWGLVNIWKYFERDTIGKQLVRSVDSIGANLSEGLGRYHFKETKNFSYYARGSLFETKTWLTKAFQRDLINQQQYQDLMSELELLGKRLNAYINTLGPNNPDT